MPYDIDLAPVNDLLDIVYETFSPAVVNDMMLYVGERVGVKAEGLVSEYPPASGKPLPVYYTRQRADGTAFLSKFKTLRQQRKVMMLIKEGKVPYKRTGTLGKSITSSARIIGVGVVDVSVGSNLDYALRVIDRDTQSHYHAGTWTPLQDDIENGLGELSATAQSSVKRWVERRLNGNG